MDDTQRIVKCGNLSLHSAGGFFKKRWHAKYLVLYDGSKSGIKRLELFDSEIKFKKQNPAKIIPLVDCVRVVTCQRHKSTYTFEVRTSDQFYLLAAQSFQDMNDWVNCLRLVAFGPSASSQAPPAPSQQQQQQLSNGAGKRAASSNLAINEAPPHNSAMNDKNHSRSTDILLDKRTSGSSQQQQVTAISRTADYVRSLEQMADHYRQPMATAMSGGGGGVASKPPDVPTETHPALTNGANSQPLTTASQAAAAAASALAKTRQRQPSLLGSCKPQPPTDSPFIQVVDSTAATMATSSALSAIGQIDTLTPTVRGQLISTAAKATPLGSVTASPAVATTACITATGARPTAKLPLIQATLDEEEENMLYCSIEDNPSEHNYRVKVIETELSLRCQLKCYQLTAPTTISQQYEQLGNFNPKTGVYQQQQQLQHQPSPDQLPQPVTFYQLIIGPQELTLLNDYAAAASLKQASQQQGLWSWPYQCIRRYGFDKDNCFMFEAGRKCTSGPGQFIVQTPKAYIIYQDVVKFVNELRSLSNTDSNIGPLPPPGGTTAGVKEMQRESSDTERQRLPTVTQIPVTWAPANSTTSNDQKGLGESSISTAPGGRQQCFDALLQLEGSPSPIVGRIPAKTTNQPADKTISQQGSTTNQLSSTSASSKSSSPSSTPTSQASSPDQIHAPTSATAPSTGSIKTEREQKTKCDAATSEETDESGYEQGDDSVDGSTTSRFKLLGGGGGGGGDGSGSGGQASRKRPAHDSMSSSSSTSSSGAGSPGHSVSRRSNGSITGSMVFSNGQGPCKRAPLSAANVTRDALNSMPVSAEAKNRGIRSLIAEGALGPPDGFEASLIRDVYSEITKLHAKFAVASGSGDDSMSSNSSNEGSEQSSSMTTDENNSVAATSSISANRHDTMAIAEPMYTNIGDCGEPPRRARRAQNFENDEYEDENDDGFADAEMKRRQIQTQKHQAASKLLTNQMQPHEQQHLLAYGQHPDRHQKLQRPALQNSYARNNNIDHLAPSARCGPIYPSVLNPIPECGELAPAPMALGLPGSKGSAKSQHVQNDSRQPPGKLAANPWKAADEAAATSRKNEIKPNTTTAATKKTDHHYQQRQLQHAPKSSKLPTNHYVINDVQYAKISRNMF